MDSEDLMEAIDFLGNSGMVLSLEKKACLQTSLILVAKDYKFKRVKFWGIIKGIRQDYYIIHGIKKDEMRDRTALYSHDCMDWKLLPTVDDGMKVKSSLMFGRFLGETDHMCVHNVTKQLGEGDDTTTTVEMKEVDRLAATISRIDEEISVAPKGAYLRTPLNEIIINKSFQGLPLNEAQQLQYYYHFKEPQNNDVNKVISQSIDFLSSLAEDIPQQSWTIHYDQERGVVMLRSLRWLGFVAYHKPNTSKYGYTYNGNGEKNNDILFML